MIGQTPEKPCPHCNGTGKVSATFGLTPEEIKILKHLANGLTVKEIAVLDNRAVKTVETHKFNLMKKLGLHKTVHLTLFSIRHGLIDASDISKWIG